MRRGQLILRAMSFLASLTLLAVPGAAPSVEEYVPMDAARPGLGGGGLRPLQDSAVVLVSEDLLIRTYESMGGYRAEAVYGLHNPGSAITVRFGVPVAWDEASLYPSGPGPALLDSVEVLLDGRRSRCEAVVDGGLSPDGTTPGWCAVKLEIPKGDSRVEVRFAGGGYENEIRYPLWPLGSWKTSLRRLNIRVEGVPAPERAMVLSPAGVKRKGSALLWNLTDADLRQVRELHVLGHRHVWGHYFPGWERTAATLTAGASSSLAPEGGHSYEPAKALDGEPGTAWCEGAPGDGEGQWLEVRAEAPARPGWECAFLDATVVPGLAATPKAYAANGRPRRVKLGPCAGGPGVEAKITEARGDTGHDQRVHIAWRADRMSALGPELERAPIWIQLPPRALGGERACLRLTILDVLPGEKFHDTCVSEFTPRLYCHPRP